MSTAKFAVVVCALLLGWTAVAASPLVSGSENSTLSSPGSNWITYHDDLHRDGFDSKSSGTFPPSVSWETVPLDGSIFAEPLVYNGVVYVATENNSIYAFEAASGNEIWRVNLGAPVPASALQCSPIDPVGITGTPAIDPTNNVLYAVAYLYLGSSLAPLHMLFGINAISGQVVFKFNVNPIGINSRVELQRGALAIANGIVYVTYGGLGDCGTYHGYVVGVSEKGNAFYQYKTPSGGGSGIWASSGPAVDSSGSVFVTTGNSGNSKFDYGDSVIMLSPNLKEVSYFAPLDYSYLNVNDVDLGSSGPAILGSTGLIFQIGKQGVGYLLNLNDLGGVGGQVFLKQICSSGNGGFGGTAYANKVIYVPCLDGLVALKLSLSPRPSFSVLWRGPQFSGPLYNAGPPIVSAGAVWTVDLNNGLLYAFNTTSGAQLYSYNLGAAASTVHFLTPASANDRIFVASNDTLLAFSI